MRFSKLQSWLIVIAFWIIAFGIMNFSGSFESSTNKAQLNSRGRYEPINPGRNHRATRFDTITGEYETKDPFSYEWARVILFDERPDQIIPLR